MKGDVLQGTRFDLRCKRRGRPPGAGSATLKGSALLALLVVASPAAADSLTFVCQENDVAKPSTMTATYEGGEDGTVKVTASFGELSFPAGRRETSVEVDGKMVPQTEIYGFGKAHVLMPAKAALEACIKTKRASGDTNDAGSIKACHATIDTTPLDVDAEVSIAIADYLPGPNVTIRRTYLEPSQDYLDGSGTPGGYMTVENAPLPSCVIAPPP